MEKGLDVRSTRVQWDIVMVMEDGTPHLAHIVHQEIDAMERLFSIFPPGQARHARLGYWRAELERLRAHLPRGRHNRSKRGLMDVVGYLSQRLFGTATDSEVQQLQDKVLENRNSLRGVMHIQRDFMSIVNVSHNELVRNRDAINNLTHSMHELKHWVARILVDINEYVHGIITYNKISEQVLRITQHVDLYEELVRVQELQRAALETGNLQERLLPRHILGELTTLPEMAGAELITPLEFYYMHVKIVPLWGGRTLGFKVSIPLVDPTVYLGYQLKTFPVPIGNVSATITILGSGKVAVDPHTGGLFQADECLGTNPLICPPVPVHRDMDHIGCTQAIILGRDVTQYCSATIENFAKPKEQVLMQGPNHLVIVTQGSVVTERCPYDVTKKDISKGTHQISWNQACMLHTSHWAIPGLTTFRAERTLNSSVWKPLDFLELNYERDLLDRIQLGSIKIPSALEAPQTIKLNQDLMLPSVPSLEVEWERAPVVTNTTIAVIVGMAACIVLGGIGLALYIRRVATFSRIPIDEPEAPNSVEQQIEPSAPEEPHSSLRSLGWCLNASSVPPKDRNAQSFTTFDP